MSAGGDFAEVRGWFRRRVVTSFGIPQGVLGGVVYPSNHESAEGGGTPERDGETQT